MKALTAPVRELAAYDEIQKRLQKERAVVGLSGCVDSQKLHMVYGLGGAFPCKLIVTFSDLRAREIYEDCQFYDRDVMLFPAKDLIFYQADVHGNQLSMQRMKCLRRILEQQPVTVVTTFAALMAPQPPLSALREHRIEIRRGGTVQEAALADALVEMGYEKSAQAELPGQFSIRGGIVDVFDLTEENPYRIELWGDEVDSIRSFDAASQRSIENLESVCLYPATELAMERERLQSGLARIEGEAKETARALREQFLTEEAHRLEQQIRQLREDTETFRSMVNLEGYVRYFYEDTVSLPELFAGRLCLYLDEPARIREHAEAVELEFRESMTGRAQKGYALPGQMGLLRSVQETAALLTRFPVVLLSAMETKDTLLKPEARFDVMAKSMPSYHNSFDMLVGDLKRYRKDGFRILLLSASRTRAKRLAEDLTEQGVTAFYSDDPERELASGEIMTCYGRVRRGFSYPLLKLAVIAESDIFGAEKKKKKRRRTFAGQKINDFNELKPGDYVVHETHGLGIYRGIEKVEMEKVVKDYMKIEYRDGGILYILATGFDAIQKYASADAAKKPKLNKLGTQEWNRTKTKVRGAVSEIARDLVRLYAVRQEKSGYAFSADTVWQREFEELFPYEETADQTAAIEAVKRDMESDRIMDRLICGDVGYGKTEIAIRAAFKAVQDGRQVVFLVPTTILAQQHYHTFLQRMKDFPVRVDLLSRFRTAAEQKATLEALAKGLCDIVIGTHRVLSGDIRFRSLGLLIIDEEQRFGVAHKEKLKKMKENVDVLTLTATPIPRTLHMSLSGIRDMSVLEEPPGDRLPVQTYVMEYNEELVREAILRELARGGQVYYVYNRVHPIADITAEIRKLVPEASVAFAHGQMKERELEGIMYDFINGGIDVLVSTTIIETGLDISNANTIIVHDADNMGLAQLYQLRGRVGRSNRTAYAFFLYRRDKLLKEVAEKRLQAIREFTEFGSGFKIAMRDLEIRGAGNLLGTSQSGHMEAVGYDLYCKMLSEEVGKLKGESAAAEDFDTLVDLDVDAYIPASYIVNETQKLDIYKRIAGIETPEERDDMREELKDRFGAMPCSVENLLRIALVRAQAHRLYVTEIKGKRETLTLQMKEDARIRAERIPELLQASGGRLRFSAKGVPVFTCRYTRCGVAEKDAQQLLELTEELVGNMRVLAETEEVV